MTVRSSPSEGYQRCTLGVWDTSIPGITFDGDGVSNYARMFQALEESSPRGKEGLELWERRLESIRQSGKGKTYDCLVGVSGGTDSCYLLHLAREWGLRPLAVNIDNGWNSDIAVSNIKRVTTSLDIDLETYVIDYGKVKKVLRAYMKASLPWADHPTDHAIRTVLSSTARREGIKYVLTGSDFRSEGKQPTEWTYGDARLLKSVLKRFENESAKGYPHMSRLALARSAFLHGTRIARPFNLTEYSKQDAAALLMDRYGWQPYGGHHHENIFTRFVIGDWLPNKFGIDKRTITFSAQILSGALERSAAVEMLSEPAISAEELDSMRTYVCKKLDLSDDEFAEIWARPNRSPFDYPNHHADLVRYRWLLSPLLKVMYGTEPKLFIEQAHRGQRLGAGR